MPWSPPTLLQGRGLRAKALPVNPGHVSVTHCLCLLHILLRTLAWRAAQMEGPPAGGWGGWVGEKPEPTIPFGERTRDCSPGHAGRECPQLARTGASQGFPRAAAPVGVFSRGTTRISGSLSCGAREVRSPCAWRGGPGKSNLPFELSGRAGDCSRVTEGQKRPHLGLCPGLNVPLKGRQGSQGT